MVRSKESMLDEEEKTKPLRAEVIWRGAKGEGVSENSGNFTMFTRRVDGI